MNQYLFIYITEESFMNNVAETGEFEFDPPLGLNSEFPFYVISKNGKIPKTTLDEDDFPQAMLVYDKIAIDVFCQNTSKISTRYERLFIVYHTFGIGKPEIISNISFSFKEKCKFERAGHHSSNSFYKTAVEFIYANSPEEINAAALNAFKVFKEYEDIDNKRKPKEGNPF